MCFSFEVSITTFIISWSIAIHLLNKKITLKQRNNLIMLMIFSSVQIVDAILWYIKMDKNNINYIVTSFLLPSILSLQLYYNVFMRNKNSNKFIYYIRLYRKDIFTNKAADLKKFNNLI